jgi:hypothetical protein
VRTKLKLASLCFLSTQWESETLNRKGHYMVDVITFHSPSPSIGQWSFEHQFGESHPTWESLGAECPDALY